MDKYIPKIEKPSHLKHSKARSLLLKYKLSIGELLGFKQKLYKRGELTTNFDSKKIPQ